MNIKISYISREGNKAVDLITNLGYWIQSTQNLVREFSYKCFDYSLERFS